MNNNSKELLLIFTRNPELGKCKTRLAAKIGDEQALEVYKFLLGHTAKITENLNVEKYVYYSEAIWEDDIWSNRGFIKKLQQGNDLGERMHHAFQDGFSSGFNKIIIIGSDMYNLSKDDIQNAFKALNVSDYVIGPAEDGGYYLLGMKKMNAKLFKEKKWGKDSVLTDTLANLKNEKLTLLDERNDIDLYEDIAAIEAFQPFLKHLNA